MEKIKVYVVGGDICYASWLDNYEIVDKLEDAKIVIFTGGEDVDPSLYGKQKNPRTYSNLDRDLAEKAEFEKIKPNQLVIGICRGSQFICVMNGGILVQDCEGHAICGTHLITNMNNIYVDITSTHHQMQYPFYLNSSDYTLLYWSASNLSPFYDGDGVSRVFYEPEIVLYHKEGMPKCLAIQGHPEYMRKEAPIIEILNNIVNKCLEDL